MYIVDKEKIKQIPWFGDSDDYDLRLFDIGRGLDEFIIPNPNVPVNLSKLIKKIPNTNRCVVWYYEDQWIAKRFNSKWKLEYGYYDIQIPKSFLKFNYLWIKNPDLKNIKFEFDPYRNYLPTINESYYELVWYLDPKFSPSKDKIWAVKCKNQEADCLGTKDMGFISPEVNIEIEYNSNLPKLEYDIDYSIPFYDLSYEHVWMLDEKHCQNAVEDIWAIKIRYTKVLFGSKIVGSISPLLKIEYNQNLYDLKYDIDYAIPYHDLAYEHVWMLDAQHCENAVEDIWAVKISATTDIVGTKIIGEISPTFEITYNSELPKMEYDLSYIVPYHDLAYEHVWMLDSKHCKTAVEDIWALKASATDNPIGTKIVGEISPTLFYEVNKDVQGYIFDLPEIDIQYHDLGYKHVFMLEDGYNAGFDIWAIRAYYSRTKKEKYVKDIAPDQKIEFNKDLKNLKIKLNYKIPYHDRHYDHVWYLDKKFSNDEKIWAVKIRACEKPVGEKEMGIVVPEISDDLDVIFISYNEPNAEVNWQRVLIKAPHAKRVDGVKGIFEAHKAAASLANTDMFYVVDGDAWLVDDWQFDYQPGIFDRDCAYVWQSINPINELVYEHGGVKLFSKDQLLKKKSWDTLDMTTGIMPKLKTMKKVSNLNSFNTDEFSTWRTAFRESVKLWSINKMTNLKIWLTVGEEKDFGKYAIDGAKCGVRYAEKNQNSSQNLLKINDYKWLLKQFQSRYKNKISIKK